LGYNKQGDEQMLGKFQNYVNAESFSNRTIKASVIMLGDDNRFWVVNLATMEKLLNAGYEMAA
jgi:hypothetical protein